MSDDGRAPRSLREVRVPAVALRILLGVVAVALAVATGALSSGSSPAPSPAPSSVPSQAWTAAVSTVVVIAAFAVAARPGSWLPAAYLVLAFVMRWSGSGADIAGGVSFAALVVALHLVASWSAAVPVTGWIDARVLAPSALRLVALALTGAVVLVASTGLPTATGPSWTAAVVPVLAGAALLLTSVLTALTVRRR